MASEPTRTIGYITTAIGAIITLLIAFGADISDPQRNAILAAVGSVVPIVIIMIELIRKNVVSPKSAGEAVAIAKTQEPTTNVVPDVAVKGFRDAAADALGIQKSMIKWQPKVDAT